MARGSLVSATLLALGLCFSATMVLRCSMAFVATRPSIPASQMDGLRQSGVESRAAPLTSAAAQGTPLAQGMQGSSFVIAAVFGLAALGVRRSSRQSSLRATGKRRRAGVALNAEANKPILRMGTRGSPLALAQAYETKRRLRETFPELDNDWAVEIKTISTTGDQRLDIPLAALGGKGLFTRELDVALMSKEVDFCVHSTKDVPTELVPGTELCTMLPREDSRDVLITPNGITKIEDFPAGSLIGTASLRRQAQILAKNPHVKCVNFRGNVQTRLRKLQAGEVAGTMLAYAGLKRMSMEQHATVILEWDEMLPAISQGAISFQCVSDDEHTLKYLKPLNHLPTMQAVTCERAFLAKLDGNCKTPIAGQAQIVDGVLHFQGMVASPEGTKFYRVERSGSPEDAADIGNDAGAEIRAEAGEQFFEEMQAYVQDIAAANTKPTKQ